MAELPPVGHPITVCPVHGALPNPLIAIGPGSSATFIDSKASCPACGRMSPIVDGTYSFVNGIVSMLVHRDIKPENLRAAQKMARAFSEHREVPKALEEQVTAFSPQFASVLKKAKSNQELLNLILIILTLLITVYMAKSADESAKTAHSDAQQQKAISQQIYDQLKQQHADALDRATQSQPTPATQAPCPPQTSAPSRVTRQQRRAAEKPWKRRPKRPR